jgi:hypothetical protein
MLTQKENVNLVPNHVKLVKIKKPVRLARLDTYIMENVSLNVQ